MKEKRLDAATSFDLIDLGQSQKMDEDRQENNEEDEEGDLLDLYICCQCSTICTASGLIPGVIPQKYVENFSKDRSDHPPPGRTGQVAVAIAWETVIKSE